MTIPRSVFRSYVRVRFGDCDPFGHVNNAVYLGYLEQAALDHAAAVGWPANRLREEIGALFVARRHEIDFRQPAYENDVLRIDTWPESLRGARAYRVYRVMRVAEDGWNLPPFSLEPPALATAPGDGAVLVTARTEWALVDVVRGRPVRIPPEVVQDFLVEDGS